MIIDDALRDIRRLYIDTSPLIYYIEVNSTYIARMDAVFEIIRQRPIQAICSIITLAEVLPVPLRVGDTILVQAYRDILLTSQEFECLPLNQRMATRAAELRARYNLKTPDALHVATALETGCDAFLTNDVGIKRISEIHVLVLDELELNPPPEKQTS